MKKILYLYGYSTKHNIKSTLLNRIIQEELNLGAEINLVLLHDAVIGISKKETTPDFLNQLLNLPLNIYALKPDIIARGLDPNMVFEKIKPIGYDDLVDLLVEVPITASWM